MSKQDRGLCSLHKVLPVELKVAKDKIVELEAEVAELKAKLEIAQTAVDVVNYITDATKSPLARVRQKEVEEYLRNI